MSKKIHLNIGGMSCVACQERIESGLLRASGVTRASVSYSGGTADVSYDESQISKDDIIKLIEGLDYEVLAPLDAQSFDVTGSVSILVIIVALYYMLKRLGILNRLVPKSLADSGMGYGMLFVLGLITSVHCIAMCGGIGLSQSLPKGSDAAGATKLKAFIPSVFYNLGRVCSYTICGFVLGLVGRLIGGGQNMGVSSMLQGILKLIAGLFMVIMGINMLKLFPQLRRFSIHMPKALARLIGNKKRAGGTSFVVGLLNGLMPCGPLQSMWIVALGSADPFAGALSMFLFALGTVPLMLGLGSVVSLLGRRFTDQVMRVGGILVVVLGLAMLSQGGALSGMLPSKLLLYLVIALAASAVLLSLPTKDRRKKYAAYGLSFLLIIGACALWKQGSRVAAANNTAEGSVQMMDGVQLANSTLAPGSYPDITVLAGVPLRWTIDAPEGSINGCNYRMLIRDYGVEHSFEQGENVIEFIPEKEGTVTYSCWMGMIHGNIYVVDRIGE